MCMVDGIVGFYSMKLGTIIITRNSGQLMELGSLIRSAFKLIYKYFSSPLALLKIQYNIVQNKITKKRLTANKDRYHWRSLKKKPAKHSVLALKWKEK